MKKLLLLLLPLSCALGSHASLSVYFTVWNETCGNANGAVQANVNGGTQPYTFVWSSGGSNWIETGLTPGWHVVTITDALSQTLTDSAQVMAVPNLEWSGPQFLPQSGLFGCGGCNAAVLVPSDPDPLQWFNVSGSVTVISPAPFDAIGGVGFLLGPYCTTDNPIVMVQDSLGCQGSFSVGSIWISQGGSPQLISTEGACLGANGSMTVDLWGGGYTIDQWHATLFDAGWNTVQTCSVGFCGSPTTFSGLASGNYHVVRLEDYYDPYGMSCPPETLDVNVPDLGVACGSVNGSLFLDHDQDCTQDAIDEAIPYHVMQISPGPEYVITNSNGLFSRNLGYGSYTLDQQAGTDLIQLCPLSAPIPFTLSSLSPVVNIAIADSGAAPFDLGLLAAHGATRLGFDVLYSLDVRNFSAALSGPLTVTFAIDPELSYVSASPVPSTIIGSTLTWNLPALGAYGGVDLYITLNVPALPWLLGTVVTCTADVSNTVPEATLANNTVSMPSIITASYDPNDKQVRTSTGWSNTQYVIGTDTWLDYTIRFQNTGTDTAFTVVVVDTLPVEVAPLSFVPGAASHPYEVGMSGDGIVSFTFNNILLPDSGTNEGASHGFVTFRAEPDQPELPGTVISNNAGIYFDFNPAVITNDAVVVLESSTVIQPNGQEQLQVFPNPVREFLYVGGISNTTHAEVFSMDGRLIMASTLTMRDPSINVASLTRGVYLLSLRTVDGIIFTQRFSKL